MTGSNSVNVFLGLGLPWIIGSMYEASKNDENIKGYFVPAGSLGFSVVIFLICAIICLITLMIRRVVVGGELGGGEESGGKFGRAASSAFLVFLWLIYIILSSL